MARPDSYYDEKGKRELKKEASRLNKVGQTQAAHEATYTSVDRDLLYAVVCAVTADGGAIRFGLTSDGGAFALGVFSNGEQKKLYIGANDDINLTLQEIGEAFSG